MSETHDVYSRVTNKIIADIEAGNLTWLQPWQAGGHKAGAVSRPLRAGGIPYRGVNVLMLWASAIEKGYNCPLWLTYKQAAELGGQVRKGEKGSLVVYANTFTKTGTDEQGAEVETEIPFMKGYTVFNAEQIDGLPAHFYATVPPLNNDITRLESAERFFASTKATTQHGGNRAFYSPDRDIVQMPELNTFRDAESYYATLAHETTHWILHIGVVAAPPPTAKQMAREALRHDYEDYLRGQRGSASVPIYHCWRFADRFLDHRFGDQDDDLRRITPGDVVAFLQHVTTSKPPFKDKTPPTHLRNFFRYLFKCGLTSANLALCVPSVAQRYGQRLPRHLAPEQVETVLAAVRASPKHGRRDYAMLLLIARLLLRAPEVVAIQLDDIDWRARELLVRVKGQRHDRVPIPPDVGEALASYIRHDRVSASRVSVREAARAAQSLQRRPDTQP